MKLMSFRRADGSASWGVVQGDAVADLGHLAPTLRAAIANRVVLHDDHATLHRLGTVTWLPPIPDPEKILCIGGNYLSHVLEGGRTPPGQPTVFSRWANTQIGHRQPMIKPAASDCLDFEGELAVIIGRTCRHVSEAEAMDVIAGYSCYNDGSVRDWQRHTTQYVPGKNFLGTGAFGPWIVTPDEFGPIGTQSLVTRLNGEEMQRATLDDLMFGVPRLIAYCTTFTQLEPGDVIITGTTGGVGAYRTPPLWMRAGDRVEVEIERIGLLSNPILPEA